MIHSLTMLKVAMAKLQLEYRVTTPTYHSARGQCRGQRHTSHASKSSGNTSRSFFMARMAGLSEASAGVPVGSCMCVCECVHTYMGEYVGGRSKLN